MDLHMRVVRRWRPGGWRLAASLPRLVPRMLPSIGHAPVRLRGAWECGRCGRRLVGGRLGRQRCRVPHVGSRASVRERVRRRARGRRGSRLCGAADQPWPPEPPTLRGGDRALASGRRRSGGCHVTYGQLCDAEQTRPLLCGRAGVGAPPSPHSRHVACALGKAGRFAGDPLVCPLSGVADGEGVGRILE